MRERAGARGESRPYQIKLARAEGAFFDGFYALILGAILFVTSLQLIRFGRGLLFLLIFCFFVASLFIARLGLRLLFTELTLTHERLYSHDRISGKVRQVRLDEIDAYAIEAPKKGYVDRLWVRDRSGEEQRFYYSPKAFGPHFLREMDARGISDGR